MMRTTAKFDTARTVAASTRSTSVAETRCRYRSGR